MHRAAKIGSAAARVVGVAAFVVLVVLVLIIKVPGWLDPGKQRDADDCSQSGDLDRRIDACTRIIGRGGGTARCPATAPCSRRNLFSAYNNRGAAYADKGDHNRAIADYKEVIGLDPKAAYAYYNRGLAHGRDYDRAIVEFDEAIRLNPKNALLRNALLVLHSFTGAADDGANPQAGLIFDVNGALYGVTESGTSSRVSSTAGTVFKLTPPVAGQTQWTQTVLYNFSHGTDGMMPETGLIFDNDGALYGTTLAGGGSNAAGTVFKLTPPAAGQTQWTETVLHSFTEATQHINPNDLIFDGNGALYGTTHFGGSSNTGMVFRLTPPAAGQTQWTYTVLHSFTGGTDGVFPKGGLIFDGDGALYGTTTDGGSEKNGGTVYKLTPPAAGQTQWTETVLYSFSRGTDGWGPNGSLIFDRNGALYGTTGLGGGFLFLSSSPMQATARCSS